MVKITDILWFKEIGKNSLNLVGGKGLNLGLMYAKSFPVPPGFVVTTEAYEKFLKETGIEEEVYSILDDLDIEDSDALHNAAEKVQNLILNTEMHGSIKAEITEAYDNLNIDIDVFRKASKQALDIIKAGREKSFVAIRSSATAEDAGDFSFAGQQASFLNVKGEDEVVKAVQKCWASLFTSRAIYYRIKNNFEHRKVLIAVVVQKMVNSEKSGVVFTKNPSTGENEIIIEAVYGLGETIVSGSVTPDHYVVDPETMQIKEKKIEKQSFKLIRESNLGKNLKKNLGEEGSQQKLTNAEIIKLADICKEIEEYYRKPQDIEFAVESGRIYIVQSRPVTTIGKKIEKEGIGEEKNIEEREEEILLEGFGASPHTGFGKVKIIHGADELNKIEQGDILVTEMTNPDYVIAMKKASGIITDAGGSTCFSGDAKVLTNLGFMDIERAYALIQENNDLVILAYDTGKRVPVWRRVINAWKRKSDAIRISVSQTGRIEHNYIDVTPEHKFFTFDKLNLIKKEINKIINDDECLCLIDKIPYTGLEANKIKLAYLCGALFTDGYIKIDYHHTGNPRRGHVVFTQKETEAKKDFIETINNYYEDCFGFEFTSRTKETKTIIRGREVNGAATDFTSTRLEPALTLNNIYRNIDKWLFTLDNVSVLSFLAGIIDGDGSFYNNRINIYNDDEKLLQGIMLACLKLGIFPQVTKNRGIYNIQILEGIEEILQYTKRVKGEVKIKVNGNKLFAAKQIFYDIIDEINWNGKVKSYVINNLLIDSRKIKERILPLAKQKEEVLGMLNSNLRMQRIKKICDLGKTCVYNLEIESDNEMDHNFVVFTKKYTPLLVSNCHAAIVSRELEVACVVGTEKATKILHNGQEVTVDGINGKVYSGIIKIKEPSDSLLEKASERNEDYDTVTKVKVNLDMPDLAKEAAETNADGIGLLRAEFLLSRTKEHPAWMIRNGKKEQLINELVTGIREIVKYFKGKPVWYRTSDMRTDEYRNLYGGEEEPKEDNPMMGWHGIRRSLDDIEFLRTEFEAIKKIHDEGFTNIGVMLPMVISVDEVRKAKELMNEVGLEPLEEIEFGVMVETPAAVEIIDEICKEGIDFISFGSNDLTQLTLGLDRNNAKLQHLWNEMHPAVLKGIAHVIKVCRENNVETSICGQAGSNNEMVEFLVKKGIDSISANIDAVTKIKRKVWEVEKRLLLSVARDEFRN